MYFSVNFVFRNGRETSGRIDATSADLLAQTIDNDRRVALRDPANLSMFKLADGNGAVTSVDLSRVDYFRVSRAS